MVIPPISTRRQATTAGRFRPGGLCGGRLHALWHTLVGAVGLIMGLLASIPMLFRLYRRFGSWIAPALGLLVFGAMFSLSAFVIGPAVSGRGGEVVPGPVPTVDHTGNHTGGH